MSSTTTQQAKVCNNCGCAAPVVDFYPGKYTCTNCLTEQQRSAYNSNAAVASYYKSRNMARQSKLQEKTLNQAENNGQWSTGEELFLEYNYRNLTTEQIAHQLRRSLHSVGGKVHQLQLRKNISRPCRPQAQKTHVGRLAAKRYANRPWDPADDTYLLKWFHTRDLDHWAALLGRTPAQVRARYKHLSAHNTPAATAV